MKWKILLGAILGLFLNKWLPYASSVSTAIILILVGNEAIRMVKLRRRFSRLVEPELSWR